MDSQKPAISENDRCEKFMPEKVTLNILNRDYYFEDEGDPLYISALGQYVEKKMKEASEKNNIVETSRIAVHAALSIAREVFELKEKKETKASTSDAKVDELIKELSSAIDE